MSNTIKTTKFFYPPRPGNGAGTFSDDIVGLQVVDGGGLTQGNFEFTTSITEKVNRGFNVGAFSDPISLSGLDIHSVEESRRILQTQFRVYPNYDVSQVLNFSMYGSLSKRLSVSVTNIINKFPASLDVNVLNNNFSTGATAENIVYDSVEDETYFTVNVERFNNPFDIDYSINSTTNIGSREISVSQYRNLYNTYLDYCVAINDNIYNVIGFVPSQSLTTGFVQFYVSGNPFNGNTTLYDDYTIRPNDLVVDRIFNEDYDEIEKFLTNRLIKPEYTALFQVPEQTQDGVFYTNYVQATWPKDGVWNLDIRSFKFDDYLAQLQSVAVNLDSFKTNLVSRFLVTDSLHEFDTLGRKVEKIFQIYGRSFDEIKKFIDGLAFVNSVNYNNRNDIPSQLLVNLSQTLGWSSNFSPITNENFLSSVFGNTTTPTYPGYARALTPTEMNYQFYRNLILNSSYLFKSKGTRRSIEFLLRLIGAPDSLIEFNEYIYLADQRINLDQFRAQWVNLSGGTYVSQTPTYNLTDLYKIRGREFTGITVSTQYEDVNISLEDYPMDENGFPKTPPDSETFFFQLGAGWYESTPHHRSPDQVIVTGEVFTGQNYNIQTSLVPFSYGQKYLDRFRKFPFMNEGFKLRKTIDNSKTWLSDDVKLRVSRNADYNAYYYVDDEKMVLNVKNVDLFLNPAQGLVYDVWDQSRRFDYPIPDSGLSVNYPVPGGVDSTFINPKPKKKTFFEFSQTFWENMINVRNRQYISDGKTGGYPTLQSIWWKYIESEQTVGVPNNKYTYRKLIDYINGIGPYWVKLVEQMVPATTIWNTGTRLENSVLNKQKFVYRRQRGCEIVPVPPSPCYVISDIFDYNCSTEFVEFGIYPWVNGDIVVNSFEAILLNRLNNFLEILSLNLNQCNESSVRSDWYIILKIGDEEIFNEFFYTGFGTTDVPTNNLWRNQLIENLPKLYNYGYTFILNANTLTITNMTLTPKNLGELVSLQVGINLSVNCDDNIASS